MHIHRDICREWIEKESIITIIILSTFFVWLLLGFVARKIKHIKDAYVDDNDGNVLYKIGS